MRTPFFNHLTFKGVSPFITEQVIEARSPTFSESVVEWKGFILGGTERQNLFYIRTKPFFFARATFEDFFGSLEEKLNVEAVDKAGDTNL